MSPNPTQSYLLEKTEDRTGEQVQGIGGASNSQLAGRRQRMIEPQEFRFPKKKQKSSCEETGGRGGWSTLIYKEEETCRR